jgi:glyoxylate reductase
VTAAPGGRVLVTRPLERAWLEPLYAAGLSVDVASEGEVGDPIALRARAAGAAALLVVLGDHVDAALLDAAGPRLRLVATISVGVDHIDLDACRERGVRVANTPDVLTDATADLAMTLLLALTRRVREGEALVRGGGWQGWEPGQLLGRDIAGARVLVVGAGRIGGAFARRVHAFGARVAYHGRSRRPALEEALGARYEPDLDAALGRADVVSLHAPLTPETRHLLDARRLALLPRRAIVINTGRGPLIDEDALVAALQGGHLWGAGLDVYEHEPRVHPGLAQVPNVVLLPHLGSATEGTRAAMARLATDAIVSTLRGDGAGDGDPVEG